MRNCVCVCGTTQPDPLSHYFYFTLLGAVAAKSYAVNLYVGNSANLFNYVRLNELDGSYIYGAITPATAPYRPSYTVNQPSYCEPLNLSCPLSPVGAPTVTNITYYPTQRIWYQGVIANRGPAFTPVYWFASGGLGVTAAMPFFVNQTRLQAPPGYQQSWYSSVFAPTPAPAGSTVQQAAGDDISLLGLSLALANVITAAKFPTNSTLVFVVETNTDFLIAASSVPSQLYVLPKNCTSSCINNCCRVQATESSDENVANAAVRARWNPSLARKGVADPLFGRRKGMADPLFGRRKGKADPLFGRRKGNADPLFGRRKGKADVRAMEARPCPMSPKPHSDPPARCCLFSLFFSFLFLFCFSTACPRRTCCRMARRGTRTPTRPAPRCCSSTACRPATSTASRGSPTRPTRRRPASIGRLSW